MLQLGVFAFGSLCLILLSRASLRVPRGHGLYRLFAWEAILALAVLALDCWFCNPLAWSQVVSWLLLLTSLILVLSGSVMLRTTGKPDPRRSDAGLFGLEKTTVLVTRGPYRYIRHPLYSSLLLLAWGAWLKAPTLPGLVLALVATFFLILTARAEEAENIAYFGSAYRVYQHRTRMFIPFLF